MRGRMTWTRVCVAVSMAAPPDAWLQDCSITRMRAALQEVSPSAGGPSPYRLGDFAHQIGFIPPDSLRRGSVRFLHLYVHRHDYTRLVRARAAANAVPVDPPEVLCPHCATPYYLDSGEAEIDRRVVRRLIQAARARLHRECPDHVHRFEFDLS